ncbi:MAG TPA: hypothetical protein VGO61_03430 [Steroidobacteraceae bacterium]|jgi:hypothetical protein|nr:hypothetical protein [Steroidobacteraceae bacterium]
MRISQAFIPLVAATLIMTGCGNKEPASRVVQQAEAALAKDRPDASLYAKDELKVAEDTLAKIKADFAKEDYDAVVAAVPDFNSQEKIVRDTIVSGQTLAAAAQTEWQTLNEEVPKTVEAIQTRVDKLAATKLPKEVTKENFDAAKADLETIKATWAEATAAASAGNALEAAGKGRTVQAKADQIKNQLGMNTAVASIAKPAAGTN